MSGELAAPFTMAVDHVFQLTVNGVPDPSAQAPTVPAGSLWHRSHHLSSTDERFHFGTTLAVEAPGQRDGGRTIENLAYSPDVQRSPAPSRTESSVGSAVGARSEVEDVPEVRGQVSMIGVAEVAGHRRDIGARLTPQPLGRLLQPAAPDHRCRGKADVLTGQPLQRAHRDSK